VLAQWTAECDVPVVYLVGASGGTPQAIKGLASVGESIALGWTRGGKALVISESGSCPGSSPRLIEISQTGAILEHWTLTQHEADGLERSVTPRPVGELLP
jgi:hypothetical protein